MKNQKPTFKRSQVLRALRASQPRIVEFKKASTNEIRVMIGTRNLSHLPKSAIPSSKKNRRSSPGVITIFDLEIESWRSFRLENLISIH